MVDTERIKKLLKLTTSTFNGEALNAIRKANEEIQRNGQTWDDVLGGKCESKKSSSFDDLANKMIIQSLRKQADDLRKEREEYKKDYWDIKYKYDDLKKDYVKEINKKYTESKSKGSKQEAKSKPESGYSKQTIDELYKKINSLPYGSKERSRLFDELDRIKSSR